MKSRDLQCFKQVANVIGPELADHELQRVIDSGIYVDPEVYLFTSFRFAESQQEYDFWDHVSDGENPYEYGYEKPSLSEKYHVNSDKNAVPESESGDKPQDMKFDGDKIRMELLPFNALEAVAEVLTFGAKKYEANSWQSLDNAEERYKGALLRHFTALQKGALLDSESGLSHAAHMACDALFLLHFELEKLAPASE